MTFEGFKKNFPGYVELLALQPQSTLLTCFEYSMSITNGSFKAYLGPTDAHQKIMAHGHL